MTTKRVLLIAMLLLAAPAQAERVGIAAIVNDDIISTADVEARRDLLVMSNNIPPTPENLARMEPRVIEGLVDETLQMQEAKRLSITVKKEELDAAMARMEEGRRLPPGSLREMLEKRGLSVRSLEAQLKAQIAWSKVVQRKLRREVSISQDEIARAQAAAAADPGVPEIRLAALSIFIASPQEEAKQAALAESLAQKIRGGADMMSLAMGLTDRRDVRFSPPGWVEEDKLQPTMQQALRGLQPGQVSPPLKSMNTYQIVQLLERRTAKKVPDSTEVAIKEVAIPLPKTRDQASMLALREQAEAVRANPGSCMEEGVPDMAAKAQFVRTNVGGLPGELKSLVTHMNVGETSVPMINETAVRLFTLCERIDPALGNVPPAAEVRRALFNEKIELEAQKHMRNLKRDAFIEIKRGPADAS